MRPTYLGILVTALFAAAFVFNPSQAHHERAMKTALEQRSPVARFLGAGGVMGTFSSYHSVGVASWEELDGRVVSYGALGVVIVR